VPGAQAGILEPTTPSSRLQAPTRLKACDSSLYHTEHKDTRLIETIQSWVHASEKKEPRRV
jgi:hypothetical protein